MRLTTPDARQASTEAGQPKRRWLLLALAFLPIFLGSVDLTVPVTFLPTLINELKLPLSQISAQLWIVTAFLIGYTLSLLAVGRLSDSLGRRRVMIGAILIYLIGTALVIGYQAPAALLRQIYPMLHLASDLGTTNLHAMVFGRLIAGFGAGAMPSITLELVGDLFDERHRAFPTGLTIAVDTVGWLVGGLWGALFIASGNWRAIFITNMVIIAAALIAVWWFFPRKDAARQQHPLDGISAILLTAFLLTLNLLLTQFVSNNFTLTSRIALVGIAALVLLIVFVWRQAVIPNPLIDIRLFRHTNLSAAAMISFLSGVSLFVAIVSLPLISNVRHFSELWILALVESIRAQAIVQAATESGILLGAFGIPIAITSGLGGLITQRFGTRASTAAGVVIAGSGMLLLFSRINIDIWSANAQTLQTATDYTFLISVLIGVGTGIGLIFPGVISVGFEVGENSEALGAAAALILGVRFIGMMIAINVASGFIPWLAGSVVTQIESDSPLFPAVRPDQYPTLFSGAYMNGTLLAISQLMFAAVILLAVAALFIPLLKERIGGKTRRSVGLAVMLVLVFLALSKTPVTAQNATLPEIATEFPADVDLFAVLDTRLPAFTVLNSRFEQFQLNTGDLLLTLCGTIRLPSAICTTLLQSTTTAVAVRNFAGLVASGSLSDPSTAVYAVIDIHDRRPLIELALALACTMGGVTSGTTDHQYTCTVSDTEQVTLTVTDTYLYLRTGTEPFAPHPDPNLSGDASFAAALADLPDNGYPMRGFLRLNSILADLGANAGSDVERARLDRLRQTFTAAGLDISSASGIQGIAFGLAAHDPNALFVDLAAPRAQSGAAPAGIDPSFVRYIPASASFVMHSHDFESLVRSTVGALVTLLDRNADPAASTVAMENQLGFNFNDPALSWVHDADYAVFADLSTLPYLNGTASAPNMVLGMVVNIPDTNAAASLRAAVLNALAATMNGVGCEETEPINGSAVPVTVIGIPSCDQPTNVALGNTGNVFFIVARSLVPQVFDTASANLLNTSGYTAAASEVLSDPIATLYVGNNDLLNWALLSSNLVPTPASGLLGSLITQLPHVVSSVMINAATTDSTALLARIAILMQENPSSSSGG